MGRGIDVVAILLAFQNVASGGEELAIREDRPHRQVVAPLEVARARIGHRSAITCGDHDISTGVGENSYNVGRELRPASNHVGDGNLVVGIR